MKRNRKFFSIIIFILFAISAIVILTPMDVHAEGRPSGVTTVKDYYEYIMDDANGYGKTVKSTAKFIYGIYGDTLLSDMTGVLTLSDESDDLINAIWSVSEAIFNVLLPIGIGIILIYFMTDMIDKSSREQLSLEIFLRSVIKLLFGLMIILSGFQLVKGFVQLGGGITDLISSKAGTGALEDTTANEIGMGYLDQVVDSANWIECAWISFTLRMDLFLVDISYKIFKIVVMVLAYGRMLEIGIRAACAPIGLSDFVTQGISGNAFKYLKKLIAVGLQGGLILIVLSIYENLSTALANSDAGGSNLLTLVVMFTTITLLLKSQSFADNIMGV